MATNKNITMKNYNGTDYDTLYPKTQTSQVLGNWDLTKVSGLLPVVNGGTGVNSLDALATNLQLDGYSRIATGWYKGTGTYGEANKNSLTFDFYPYFMQIVINTSAPGNMGTSLLYAGNQKASGSTQIYVDGKTIYWSGSSADAQENVLNTIYNYVVIGNNNPISNFATLITRTGSGSVVLPVSGYYYLEMHGSGGFGTKTSFATQTLSAVTGSGSGQVYDSLYLTAGVYSVDIASETTAGNGSSTTFGSYSVAGGTLSTNNTIQQGSGNVGGQSLQITCTSAGEGAVFPSYSNGGGKFPQYGTGGAKVYYDGVYRSKNGTQGAIYIEYLHN